MSDKKKGSSTKAQSGTAKASLKQRTLLDSFSTRTSTRTAISVPQDTVEMVDPLKSQSSPTNSPKTAPHMNGLDVVEVFDDSPPNSPSTATSFQSSRRRSPSIVLMEDAPDIKHMMPAKWPKRLQTVSANDDRANGKSKHQPIVIDSSLIKGPASRPNKAIHPFFLPKCAAKGSSVVGRNPVVKSLNESLLYPQGFPQHVRGVQTAFQCHSSLWPSRRASTPKQVANTLPNYHFLKSSTISEAESPPLHAIRLLPLNDKNSTNGIPENIKTAHPAVARLVDLNITDKPASHRPWADKWRPSCAQEVLGNEQNAIYLRDWLRALELEDQNVPTAPTGGKNSKDYGKAVTRGTKRPLVVRTVDKHRRKKLRLDSDDDEDNWILYTDEEEDEEQLNSDEFDEFGELVVNELPGSSPSSSVHELSQQSTESKAQPLNFAPLHNTIVLTGPSGCGKTASVYACAEELGWDIFEVYPGIGRRNAANLDNLVGEVGKNHLVLQSRTAGDYLKTFLQSKAQRKVDEDDGGSTALSQISPRKRSAVEGLDPEPPTKRSVRQSLILLEEVDILFKEDTNFWSTVTKIIAECKRPVVCTCNDLSLVPVQDLPLQAILFYTPCHDGPAACYLQALCAAEGYSVSWKDILPLYSNSRQSLCERSNPHVPDLRATINALQAISAGATIGPIEEEGPPIERKRTLGAPRISVRRCDFLSLLDGDLDHNWTSTYSVLSEDHNPSDNDETGHIVLFDQHAEDNTVPGIYDRQREILSAARQLGSQVFEIDINQDTIEMQAKEDELGRIRERQRITAREVCRMGVDEVTIAVEYIPFLREIMETEDVLEMKEDEERRTRVGRMTRMTRNSARREYVRMVELTEEGRQGVENRGFLVA